MSQQARFSVVTHGKRRSTGLPQKERLFLFKGTNWQWPDLGAPKRLSAWLAERILPSTVRRLTYYISTAVSVSSREAPIIHHSFQVLVLCLPGWSLRLQTDTTRCAQVRFSNPA